MRKILVSLLLATAAASPALAGPGDPDRQAERRERAERPDREERQQMRAERQQQRVERQEQRADRPGGLERARADGERRGYGEVVRARPDAEARRSGGARQTRPFDGYVLRERSIEDARASGGLRETRRPVPDVLRNRVPVVSNQPREGTQPPPRLDRRPTNVTRWNHNWRNDRRHDWRRWRDRHRSLFRLGIYYDPFGWGYRPYSAGWRMWPSHYGSRYWINDPWAYRLPYAPPGYRWVRYWDDAILVDTWNGQVVDVIRNFFW